MVARTTDKPMYRVCQCAVCGVVHWFPICQALAALVLGFGIGSSSRFGLFQAFQPAHKKTFQPLPEHCAYCVISGGGEGFHIFGLPLYNLTVK